MTNTDIATLRKRLAEEQAHLKWFDDTGQTMGQDGADTDKYRANVQSTIKELRARIAAAEQKNG